MASFIGLYNGTNESIFGKETNIQVRVTQEDKEAFDSFQQKYVHTELYVVIYFDEAFSPNHQIPVQTTIEDACQLDEAYCYQCSERKKSAIQSEVWFRSDKQKQMHTLCMDCAEKLMKCKELGLAEVSESKIAEKIV